MPTTSNVAEEHNDTKIAHSTKSQPKRDDMNLQLDQKIQGSPNHIIPVVCATANLSLLPHSTLFGSRYVNAGGLCAWKRAFRLLEGFAFKLSNHMAEQVGLFHDT